MGQSSLSVQSAQYKANRGGPFVHVVLSDGTEAGMYLEDGSPHGLLRELLDEWIAAGNQIDPSES